jgi:pre-mRNA-splicing factor 38A
MANVTDPLAAFLHGTDPQNLMEYITRQKIYDCRYWKEECFGLTAVNVLEKASTLKCIGASFGGNMQPTKFLCLVLKLLQIQPSNELVDEFIQTEDFKYVRALGAFYKRLTGRPADIYKCLEPLYLDYRKLRYRHVDEWKIVHMDEFIHSLLTEERVCGIALPRLPQRKRLEQEGYLEGPRTWALTFLLVNNNMTAQEYLHKKVEEGSVAAKVLWESRQKKSQQQEEEEEQVDDDDDDDDEDDGNGHHRPSSNKDDDESGKRKSSQADSVSFRNKRSKKEQYGSLFKSKSSTKTQSTVATESSSNNSNDKATTTSAPEEGSDEYWNKERAMLGLKPLK